MGFSYQLYSSRNFPPLANTLKELGDAGYDSAEGYGGVYGDLAALAEGLKANGLTMPTGHFGIDQLENDVEGVLNIARTVGMKRIYCPYLMPDQRPTTLQGWRDFGARLQKASAPYKAAGYGFGWHNHDFEFFALEGSTAQDAIFEGGPDLEWEMDVAWVVRGGADPLAWIDRHGHRVTTAHVKDIAPKGEKLDEDGWADVGTGTVDWKAIMAALRSKTPCSTFVMEHDNPSDQSRFITVSITNAKAL